MKIYVKHMKTKWYYTNKKLMKTKIDRVKVKWILIHFFSFQNTLKQASEEKPYRVTGKLL